MPKAQRCTLVRFGSAIGFVRAVEGAVKIARLAPRFPVIAPDLLCFGRSTGPPGGAHFTTQAHAIRQLLDHLELGRFHLLVHDWGGPIGLAATAIGLVLRTIAAASRKRRAAALLAERNKQKR